jgi:hypothetical protein
MWEEQSFAAKGHDWSMFFPVFLNLRSLTTDFFDIVFGARHLQF